MRDGSAPSPFAEAGRLASRATMLLQLQRRGRTGDQSDAPALAWATGFFFTDTLAMTAAHNLVLHHSGAVVRAIYKERFITLAWLRDWSDVAADVAVLQLKKCPADVQIDCLPAAYLDPSIPTSERRRFWAGRTVVAYGYALRDGSPEGRQVDGLIDTEMPLVDTYVTHFPSGASSDSPAHPRQRMTAESVQRLRIKGSRLSQLRGLSGAAIFDLELRCAVAVQGSYVPDDSADPDPGDARATEVGQLVERVPELRRYCVPLHPSGNDRRRDDLPADLTPFIGREREVAEVRGLLERHRVVTLIGPGGVGKTRLATQVARETVDATLDGVWWVELGSVSEPALVLHAVANAVGVETASDRRLLRVLAGALGHGRQVLVLDNCEHLVDACAGLVSDLLLACPQLLVLATSRDALRCKGEAVWSVPPFGVPPAADLNLPLAAAAQRFDSVRLFVERAAAARPGFALTDSDAWAVADICRRLDGLPLAIELAAARLRGLSVGQIAAGLDDRFRLLADGSRTAPARHRTLRAVIDWSYALLSPPERRLFDRLSSFVGGFTLEAAEVVGAGAAEPAPAGVAAGNGHASFASEERFVPAPDVRELLLRLVDKSLVLREDGAAGAAPGGIGGAGADAARYRLLETLREYGRERLAASGLQEQVHRRHLKYYLGLIEQVAEESAPRSARWLLRLEAERDDLWAALRRVAGQTDDAADRRLREILLRLAGRLADPAVRQATTPLVFELRRLMLPAYTALERGLLEQTDPDVLAAGTDLYRLIGDRTAEATVLERRLELEQDEGTAAGLRVRLARLLVIRGRTSEAIALLERLKTWALSRGHEQLLVDALLELGYAHFQTGDCRPGQRAFARGLALVQRLQSRLSGEAVRRSQLAAQRGLGNIAYNAGANVACAARHRVAQALAREVRDGSEEVFALINLADALWGCWSYGEALQTFREALRASDALCFADGREFGLQGRGAVLWSIGQDVAAAEELSAGLELARGVGSAWSTAFALAYLSNVQASRGAITEALAMSREAIALAQGAGAAYPLHLATLYASWQQEVRAPGWPEHRPPIEASLREARRLGLRGLALQLAWVRLLHRVADRTVSTPAVERDLQRLVHTTDAHPPVRGASEVIGLQVVHALQQHRPAVDTVALQRLIAGVCAKKAASLGSGEWAVYRERYLETRRHWEDRG